MQETSSPCRKSKDSCENAHPESGACDASNSARNSVLIVDDFETNRSLLTHMMKHLGFQNIAVAESGEAGLDIWKRHQHPLILLDYQMEGIDGYETCRRIRRSASGNLPTILGVSATVHAGNLDLAIQAGFCGQIPKPVSRLLLKEMLKSLGWGFDPTVPPAKNV